MSLKQTKLPERQSMTITNKITGEDVTKYVIGLLEGLITQDEFEELTMITK